MAGGQAPQLQVEADLVKAIRETGRTPVQRNTFYEPINVWEPQTVTSAGKSHAQKSAVLEKNLAAAWSRNVLHCPPEQVPGMMRHARGAANQRLSVLFLC